MNGKIFIDSSAWIAYANKTDQFHQRFLKLFDPDGKSDSPFYTSNDVIDETYTRIRYDVGWYMAEKFIGYLNRAIKTNFLIQLWTDEQIQAQAFDLLQKYKDHDLSLTDATSAILMKNFHITTVFTLDSKHFAALGFKTLPRL